MFRRILVPVDQCPGSVSTVKHAFNLSRLLGSHVTLAHVLIKNPPEEDDFEKTQRWLERLAIGARFQPEIRVILGNGQSVPNRILELSRREKADLIVLGAHSHQVSSHPLLGSVAQAVAGASTVPVQLVPISEQPSLAFADRWRRALMVENKKGKAEQAK
jgi:nucleotide-binding universal stress UspA family protein